MSTMLNMLRTFMIVILSLVQILSLPVTFHAEDTTQSLQFTAGSSVVPHADVSSLETDSHDLEHHFKPAIRKSSPLLHLVIAAAKSLPFVILIALVLLLSIPKLRLPFIPVICKLKKQLYLFPIKFTSSYVA
ncbi:hypothetical protein MF628_000994 [Paenibacillus polymyxa]|uniref:hypothetical protein n=1 Tax=Paenibacillus polymyxa TaxID=1406 RepID=UPI0020245AA6|nr:hypothetical protein [Paenibacillus polymyxa]URJ46457.1 hypothetical protein MF628_000994 [Paenibacillus polymyxa]